MRHIAVEGCGTNKTRTLLNLLHMNVQFCAFTRKMRHHSVVLTQRPRTMNEIVDITTQLCIA